MNGTIVFKDGHREKISYFLRTNEPDITDSVLCDYSLFFASESGIYKMRYRRTTYEEQNFYKLVLTDFGMGVVYEENQTIDYLTFDEETENNKMFGKFSFKEDKFEPLAYGLIREIIKECRNDKNAQINLFVNTEGSMNLSIMPIIEKEKK